MGVIADYCALFLNLALICSLCYRNKFWTIEDKVFCFLLGVCTVCTIADIIALCGAGISGILVYAASYIYFITRNMTPFLYLCYTLTLIIRWHELKKKKIFLVFLFCPIAVTLGIIVTNPISGGVFYYDEAGVYHRGELLPVLYTIAIFYAIFSIWYVAQNKHLIGKEKRTAIYTFMPLTMSAAMIQLIIPDFMVEMFSTSVCLMLIMFTLQKKEEIVEGVTGLRNRTTYLHDIHNYFNEEKIFSVVSVNVKNLHILNDTIGVSAVEDIMNDVACYLRGFISKSKDVYAMRSGRFNIILSKNKKDCGEEIANKILDRFHKPWMYEGLELNLQASIGLTNCPKDIGGKEDLMNFTDTFHRQTTLEEKIVYAVNYKKKEVIHKEEMERMIEEALLEKKFEIYYQPIYSMESGKFSSAEALLRLYNEKYGFIPPDVFIPVAEENTSILQIGDYVIESVCEFIMNHNLKELGVKFIEINLSVIQCMQADLAEHIMKTINKYGIDPAQINFEVTETATIYSPDTVVKNMEQLGKSGIKFSLDDFGSGNSNINYLLKFPFSIIKLDKTMVCPEAEGHKSWTALRYTTKMLHEMEMEIVAEGVETEEMVESLAKLKCHYLQGYYYSKPIPADAYLQFIRQHN